MTTRITFLLIACGLGTLAIKAAGPIAFGGRRMSSGLKGLLDLMAPCLLTALIVVQVFSEGSRLVFDERLVGVGAAAVALGLKANILVVVVVAALTTAMLRAWTG